MWAPSFYLAEVFDEAEERNAVNRLLISRQPRPHLRTLLLCPFEEERSQHPHTPEIDKSRGVMFHGPQPVVPDSVARVMKRISQGLTPSSSSSGPLSLLSLVVHRPRMHYIPWVCLPFMWLRLQMIFPLLRSAVPETNSQIQLYQARNGADQSNSFSRNIFILKGDCLRQMQF